MLRFCGFVAKDHLSSVEVFHLLLHKGIFTDMYNLWEELFPLKILVVTDDFPLQIFMKESKALKLMRVDYWCPLVLVVWTTREQVCCSLLLEITVETVEMKDY